MEGSFRGGLATGSGTVGLVDLRGAASPSLAHVKSETAALSELDVKTGVIEALENEYIRLVRSAWLLAQPAHYRLEQRQRLEEHEARGESPLLSGREAADLVRRADRSAGVLSHGWLSPGDVRHRA